MPHIRIFIALLLSGVAAMTQAKPAPSHSINYLGYARIGLGVSEDGSTQAAFQAPGSRAKYRLGNEADTYAEIGVDHRYAFTEAPDRYMQTVVRLAGFAPHGQSSSFDFNEVAELYTNAANFLGAGINVWLGRRFYDRKDIHMNDYFWLNSGQGAHAGAGIEGLSLGPGELKLAVFRLEDPKVPSRVPFDLSTGTLNSSSVDIRWANLPITEHSKLTGWAFAAVRHEQADLGYDDEDGFGIGAWLDHAAWLGGSNTLAISYRTGAALTQGKVNARPVREDQAYRLADASVFELDNNYLYEPGGKLALQWALIYRAEQSGLAGIDGDQLTWISTGLRPIYSLSQHLSLALEVSVDRIDDERNARSGNVYKTTLALQLAQQPGYYERPVLRVFITHAAWSDAFQGLVGSGPGDAPYGDQTDGWTAGLQLESWW